MIEQAYQRADFDKLRDTKYGIGFHWTTWTAPRKGKLKPFNEAIEAFDVRAFVAAGGRDGCGAPAAYHNACAALDSGAASRRR